MKLIKRPFILKNTFWVVLFIFLGVELIVFSYYSYTPTANNDVYHQLLSSEKIIKSFDFSDVNPHPLGIPLFSSILIYNNIDPIHFLKWVSPLIITSIFLILFLCLKNIGYSKGLLVSFLSCTHLFFLKIFNQFNAEIVCFVFMILSIFFTVRFLEKYNSNKNDKYLILLFISSFMSILFRDSFFFIILGCYIFIFFKTYKIEQKKVKLVKIILPMFIFFSPIFYRLLHNPQSSNLKITLSLEMINERIQLAIVTFFSLFKILPEITLPKLIYFDSKKYFLIGISVLIILGTLYMLFSIKKRRTIDKNFILIGQLFLCISVTYLSGISIASGVLDYKWGNLYRVNGIFIFCFGIFFWILLLEFLRTNKNRLATLIFIFFLSQIKLFYAVRYEYYNSKVRFLYADHSIIEKQIFKSIHEIKAYDTLNVFNGGRWQGRNLFSLLKYNAMIKKSLSFQLKSQKNIYVDKNLLISNVDYDIYFKKNRKKFNIKSLMNGRLKLITPILK
mgnify:CR=1 FL=1